MPMIIGLLPMGWGVGGKRAKVGRLLKKKKIKIFWVLVINFLWKSPVS